MDYLLNTRLNLQFYFTQTITQPRVSNAFRNATGGRHPAALQLTVNE
ncbi:MAG: hypothetical protein WKG07_07970 [Hymenobacter sp.]